MQLNTLSFIILGLFLISGRAHGADLRCDAAQALCTIETMEMGVGDKVSFFNSDGNLVAIGNVKSFRGQARVVDIEKKYTDITAKTTYRTYREGDEEKRFQEALPFAIGGGYAFTRLGIGNGSVGHDISATGSWRKLKRLAFTGRANLLLGSGELDRNLGAGAETKAFSMFGFGIMPGVAVTAFDQQPVSMRADAGLGLMFVSASVGGNAAEVTGAGFDARLVNGINIYMRASLTALFNVTADTHLEFGLAQSLINQAAGTGLFVGVLKDLK